MAKLELQSGYIVDAIIKIKKKRFDEEFTTLEKVNIIKQEIQKRIKEKNLKVKIFNAFFERYFNIINGVITKDDKETESLKIFISDLEIRETIYDENLIYSCLCEIIINKLNDSIEHTCSNCNSVCCGGLLDDQANNCRKWTNDFTKETKKVLKKTLEI